MDAAAGDSGDSLGTDEGTAGEETQLSRLGHDMPTQAQSLTRTVQRNRRHGLLFGVREKIMTGTTENQRVDLRAPRFSESRWTERDDVLSILDARGGSAEFEGLLAYLQHNNGFDFTGYRRPTLARRICRRMDLLGIQDFPTYRAYLMAHSEEFVPLLKTVLINVTSFFRDAPAWNFLAHRIVPRILDAKKDNEPIRVWSAGCASGEEVYTITMILAEVMGDETLHNRVTIFGTDVDDVALIQARRASYTAQQLLAVPVDLRRKYFETGDGRYGFSRFRSDARPLIVFGHHDVIHDPPYAHLDLIVCRNTLMYFNTQTQKQVLARFHFALNDDGYLFLGKAESLTNHESLFTPVNLKYRVFAKASMPRRRSSSHLEVV